MGWVDPCSTSIRIYSKDRRDVGAREENKDRLGRLMPFVSVVCLAFGIAAPLSAGEWSVQLGVVAMDAYGHDQHVLTIHEIDSVLDNKTAIALDTKDEFAYTAEIEYNGGTWGFGLDFRWLLASQSAPTIGVRTAGGNVDELVYEIADREHVSTGSDEALYYQVLEDTGIGTWQLDAYGVRTLTESESSRLRLLLGVKFGDFDNDYRAVAGVEGVGGTRVDSSANYSFMYGPLIGLEGAVSFGRSSFEGSLGQAVIFAGTAELSGMTRDFTGPYSESPSYFNEETIRNEQDAVIPVTDLDLVWMYRVTDSWSFGAGIESSVWWNVPVPPGVIPGEGGNEVLHENTIVYFGFTGLVEYRF